MATGISLWRVKWPSWSNVLRDIPRLPLRLSWEAGLIASLGITQAQLLGGVAPLVVNTGNSFLLVATV